MIFQFLFFLPCFLLLIICCSSALLQFNCSNVESVHNTSDIFHTNLNVLLPSLSSNAAITGFYNASVGAYPDQLYGLSLCVGDTPPETCKNCLDSVIQDGKKWCPDMRSAELWDELCYMRYSNQRFFSLLDNTVMFSAQGPQNISYPNLFHPFIKSMITELSQQAISDPSGKLFTFGKRNSTLFGEVYGLVQCTRDLTRSDCGRCLEAQLKEVTKCCYSSRGAMLLGRNCLLRYELYNFYQEPGAPTRGNKRRKLKTAIFSSIAGLVGLIVAFIISSYCYYKWRKRSGEDRTERSDPSPNVQVSNNEKYEELPLMDLTIVRKATNNFSFANKLGEGGFGPVYKLSWLVLGLRIQPNYEVASSNLEEALYCADYAQ